MDSERRRLLQLVQFPPQELVTKAASGPLRTRLLLRKSDDDLAGLVKRQRTFRHESETRPGQQTALMFSFRASRIA